MEGTMVTLRFFVRCRFQVWFSFSGKNETTIATKTRHNGLDTRFASSLLNSCTKMSRINYGY
jgi:hypothetical protein